MQYDLYCMYSTNNYAFTVRKLRHRSLGSAQAHPQELWLRHPVQHRHALHHRRRRHLQGRAAQQVPRLLQE